MLISKLIVHLPQGLQARNSVKFFVIASSFNSEITMINRGVSSGLDIMKIMDLNVKEGQEITLIANGMDEKDATNTLKEFFLGY